MWRLVDIFKAKKTVWKKVDFIGLSACVPRTGSQWIKLFRHISWIFIVFVAWKNRFLVRNYNQRCFRSWFVDKMSFILNNLNNGSTLQDGQTTLATGKPPSRLSPRVMLGVELNIMKSQSGSSSTSSSRHASPLLPRSGVTSSRSSAKGSDRSMSPPPLTGSGNRSGKSSTRIEVKQFSNICSFQSST